MTTLIMSPSVDFLNINDQFPEEFCHVLWYSFWGSTGIY